MDVVELVEIVGGREDESRYVYQMEKENSKSSSINMRIPNLGKPRHRMCM
jgi:hypothetical protein